MRDAFDLSWVLLFTLDEDAATVSDGNLSRPAQLLRLPNRRDLYPGDGIRLRLADGTLVAPASILDAGTGAVVVPDRVLRTTLSPGHGRRLAVWGVSMTRDGVPSRLAGPLVALTGPPPLAAPSLTVTRAGGIDQAGWPPLAVPALLSLERSRDGGATWRQVSPWLAGEQNSYELPAADGDVRYRVSLRADRGRRAVGAAVTVGA